MVKRLKRILPVVAVVAVFVALALALAVGPRLGRQMLLTEPGETRRVAEGTLAQLQALRPVSVDDAAFQEAVVQAREAQYVAYVWLLKPGGEILEGNLAVSQGTAEASATDEMRRVLGMLPDGTLSAKQRTALLAASAMQKEGEHNDVYRHLLREVHGPDGELVAWVGVTFDASPAVSAPSAGYISFVVGLFLAMAVYWLSLPAWVWLDARARGERAWAWAVFVLLGNLVALIAYILVHAPRSQQVTLE
jgi:hypothetical protein